MGIKKLILLLLLPILLCSQNGHIPARSTMRVYYHLEGLTDASGNSRTLTNNNSVTFTAGKFANAANFGTSGVNMGLSIGSGSNADNIMSALAYATATYSFWVKFNSVSAPTATFGCIFDLVTGVSGAGRSRTRCNYTVTAGNFVITFLVKYTTTDATFTYNIPVNTTNWYNIIMVKDNLTLTAYINGVEIGTATGSGTNTQNGAATANLTIGNRTDAAGLFQGWVTIDEFIIEEVQWTPARIRKYYTQGLGRFSPKQL